MVMDDLRTIVEFLTEMAPSLSLELLRTIEVWVHQCYWNYAVLPEGMRDDQALVKARVQVEAATITFRNNVNAVDDFVIYKTLVGHDSVLAPAWKNKAFRYRQLTEYRAKQIDEFVASVDEASADLWFDRICRYACTESDDLATFCEFAKFLERLAETKPSIALSYIARIEEPLTRFLPSLLVGLMRSKQHANALVQIETWLNAGEHLGPITWYFQLADPLDEFLLRRALETAIRHEDRVAVRNALIAATRQFSNHPGGLVDTIFLPALRYLDACGDFTWLHLPFDTWLQSPIIHALNEEQAGVVLESLVRYPRLEHSAENVVAAIAERWPASVIAFLGMRQALSRTDDAPRHYVAMPYAIYELKNPLTAALGIVLEGAKKWYGDAHQLFTYEGGRLLASVFPDLSGGLRDQLEKLISGGNEQDLAFVLSVLSAFLGQPNIFELVRKIVAMLPPGNPLLQKAKSALMETDGVSGEFGFAELYAERKKLLVPWLSDPSEQVRKFASEINQFLEQRIATENRSAETSIALRKLQYGEELDSNMED